MLIMKYFLDSSIKTVSKQELSDFLDQAEYEKIGVQVAKNNYESGKEVCDIAKQGGIESHILADSDRCCIDWIAVQHAQVNCIIKRSFSCPLLNVSRSKKLIEKYSILQYVPECTINLDILDGDVLKDDFVDLSMHAVCLALDIKYSAHYKKILEYLEKVLHTQITMWSYSKSNKPQLVLVLSEDQGFIDYFIDNYNYILLTKDILENRHKLLDKVRADIQTLDTRKTRAIISKMAYIVVLKQAKRIGIVFTSGDHMDLINLISKYLDINGKKFYQFYINGLKPNKLGNFVGIDVFVVIQCPFSSFKFEENIIAMRPYDLVLAFSEAWNGEYTTNLEVAKERISEEIKKSTARSQIVETNETAILQVTSTLNALKLSKNEICTKEQAEKYFQTGVYLKKITGITIEETVKETTDDLVMGYSGIPTEYKK
ncbi:diphthamide biosynthesis protein 2 [Nematocida sp. AWRm78]|nr:diphthamide biosynthesis protein 2 [Nematocida sp. AWRm78]